MYKSCFRPKKDLFSLIQRKSFFLLAIIFIPPFRYDLKITHTPPEPVFFFFCLPRSLLNIWIVRDRICRKCKYNEPVLQNLYYFCPFLKLPFTYVMIHNYFSYLKYIQICVVKRIHTKNSSFLSSSLYFIYYYP